MAETPNADHVSEHGPYERIPQAPPGFSNCQTKTGAGPNEYMNHLVKCSESGGTPGPTVCGLTRFDSEPGAHDAEIPGWSMRGGVSGKLIRQTRCPLCWPIAGSVDV